MDSTLIIAAPLPPGKKPGGFVDHHIIPTYVDSMDINTPKRRSYMKCRGILPPRKMGVGGVALGGLYYKEPWWGNAIWGENVVF